MQERVSTERSEGRRPLVLSVRLQNSRSRKEFEVKITADKLEQAAAVEDISKANAYERCIFAIARNRNFFTADATRYNIIKTNVRFKKLWEEYLRGSGQYIPKLHEYDMPEYPIHVYSRLQTKHMHHHVETVTLITEDSITFQKVSVNLFHCLDCDCYFINKEALDLHNKNRIYPVFRYRSYGRYDDDFEKRDFSPLFLYGYNVKQGALRESQRQALLKNIIENGLMSKMEIISFLQYLINYNGLSERNMIAAGKWHDDIRFVSEYTRDNVKMLNARDIPHVYYSFFDLCK